MRLLNGIFVLALLVTGASVAGAEFLDIPWLYDVAGLGLGVISLTSGMRIMITGRAQGAAVGTSQYFSNARRKELHTGTRARMIGALLLIAGPIVVALSIADLATPGGIDAFWDDFLRSPRAWALILGLAGVMIALMGIVRAWGGTAVTPDSHGKVVETEFRVGGVLAVIAGVVLIVLAVILIVTPDVFQGTLDDLFSLANGP